MLLVISRIVSIDSASSNKRDSSPFTIVSYQIKRGEWNIAKAFYKKVIL